MNEVEAQIERYLRFLNLERGLAKNSLAAYRRDLRLYADFLSQAGIADLESVTETTLESYLVELAATRAASSVARSLAAIRGLHRHLVLEGGLNKDAAHLVKPPKQAMRLPKAISVTDIEKLLAASGPDPFDETNVEYEATRWRDRAILELLYATGARVSEVAALDIDDLIDPTLLRLRGKGSKERIVPVGRFAQRALENYLVKARPRLIGGGTGGAAVFLNVRGGRLSRQTIWQVIEDCSQSSNLGVAVSPHTFRHSFATHLLEGGADVRVVQELLGHASVSTTQIYTLVTVDSLRESYQLAHPRARSKR